MNSYGRRMQFEDLTEFWSPDLSTDCRTAEGRDSVRKVKTVRISPVNQGLGEGLKNQRDYDYESI